MLLRVLGLSLLLAPSAAWAAWNVNAGEANMFGDTELQAININQTGHGLIVNCNQSDKLEIAFIERDISEKSKDEFPTTLYIQIDAGKVQTFDAALRAWNEKYSGAVINGRTGSASQAAKLLAGAKKSIGIGLKLGDQKIAETFDVVNQLAFTRALEKSCNLSSK